MATTALQTLPTTPPKLPEPPISTVASLETAAGKRALNLQERRFIAAYLAEAGGVASVAAKLAGYVNSASQGKSVERRLRQAIEQERLVRAESRVASPAEVIEKLSWFMREGQGRLALTATEILAKIHGLLADKTRLVLNPDELKQQIQEALGFLRSQADIVEAELVEQGKLDVGSEHST